MIRSRIKTISFREKIDLPANVIDQLVEGTQSDIRQILNILATWKLSHSSMNFDEGKGV
jgi:replication factor C subunit 1